MPVPVALAAVGDVALLRENDVDLFGLVQGEAIYALRPDGLGLAPRERMVAAWAV